MHSKRRFWRQFGKRLALLGLAFVTGLCVTLTRFGELATHQSAIAQAPAKLSALPTEKVHPLPPSLAQWQAPKGVGDYFSEVKPTPVGYLVWSEFPVQVHVERSPNPRDSSAQARRFQKWVDAVLQAVEEWGVYLPLVVVEQPEADITIKRELPPREVSVNRETGQLQIPRARSAQTRYEFYVRQVPNRAAVLSHRMTIYLSPDQAEAYTLATARHEFGHALGIWGHSPSKTDALYFSQRHHPADISARDINTLKKVYQQPTRLGWSLPNS
ncbi:MAG: peptidase [Cyanobacteria bacterium SW_12_48_29]|nr:MAG: peptidase [Cyanobacteria bacterium SW_12_48_29]PSP20242.1 MAG: peptidase [Cyanobacteria bacterium SW_5_48_44]